MIRLLVFFMPFLALAQGRVDSFKLGDQTEVGVFMSDQCVHCYRYLPTGLRVPRNEAGQPEASLLKISENEGDPITGGIMHLMLVWGLNVKQELELQSALRETVDSMAVMLGAANVETTGDEKVSIRGDGPLGDALRAALKSSSSVANSAGGKMALSFRFDEGQVKVLLDCIEKICDNEVAFEIELRALYEDKYSQQRARRLRLSLPFVEVVPFFR
jgi:hypothetical protein